MKSFEDQIKAINQSYTKTKQQFENDLKAFVVQDEDDNEEAVQKDNIIGGNSKV